MHHVAKILVICVCAMCAVTAFGDAPKAKKKLGDIAGTYKCRGTNPNGSVYTGLVTIKRAGEAYIITWNLSGQKHRGVGLYESGVFSSTWTYNNDARQSGMTTYKCLPDGQLKGRWISARGGAVNTETLTPTNAKKRSIEGTTTKSVQHFKQLPAQPLALGGRSQ